MCVCACLKYAVLVLVLACFFDTYGGGMGRSVACRCVGVHRVCTSDGLNEPFTSHVRACACGEKECRY